MSEIRRYVLVGTDGNEDDYEFESFAAAQDALVSRAATYAVVERTYVYDDSELVWTPDGSDTWPPEGGEL